jgi:hypothetical protein
MSEANKDKILSKLLLDWQLILKHMKIFKSKIYIYNIDPNRGKLDDRAIDIYEIL